MFLTPFFCVFMDFTARWVKRIILPDTFHIGTGQYGFRRRMNRIGRNLVAVEKVGNSATVRHDHVFVAPVIAKDALQKPGASATGFVVQPRIRAHHFANVSLLHQGLERREVGFVQFARVHIVQIELMPAPFGARVHGKMFGTSQQFPVFRIFRACRPLTT